MLQSLITDRTQADVVYFLRQMQKWQNGTLTDPEKTEYLAGLKGAYNAVDLNRVEGAVQAVNDYLNAMQSNLDTYREAQFVASDPFWLVPFAHPLVLSIKTDWAMSNLPTVSDMERYLGNVDRLTNQIPIVKALPATMEGMTYTGANEIERAILAEYEAGQKYEAETKRLIDNTAKAFVYSGDTFGGEV